MEDPSEAQLTLDSGQQETDDLISKGKRQIQELFRFILEASHAGPG